MRMRISILLSTGLLCCCISSVALCVDESVAHVAQDAVKASLQLQSVGEVHTSWAKEYADLLRSRSGGAFRFLHVGDAARVQLLVVDETGQRFGRFFSDGTGGAMKLQLQSISPENFFDLEPIVPVVLAAGKEKHTGYLQRIPVDNPQDVSETKRSLAREIQKVGILDVLFINQGNDALNVVVAGGRLIPTDHLCCVLNQPGLDLTKRLMDPPFLAPLFGEGLHRPFWLRRSERFVGFARKPWHDEVKAFVLNWDVVKELERMDELPGVRNDRLELLRAMHLWLKKGVEAQLNLEEVSLPVYGARGIAQDIPQLVKTARVEDAAQYAGLEYDLLLAIQKTRLDAVQTKEGEALHDQFYRHLSELFDRRIALIKGKLKPDALDGFYSEIWLNMFLRYELASRLALAQSGEPGAVPAACLPDVLDLAKQLTALRVSKEYGSEASGMRDSLESVFRIFKYYAATLYEAEPGTPDYLRMSQFLRRQIDQFDDLMVPGVIWEPHQNRVMSQMPIQDVVVAVEMVRAEAKRQAEQFQEKLGANWTALVALQSVDGALERMRVLREQLSDGRITQEQFDRSIAGS